MKKLLITYTALLVVANSLMAYPSFPGYYSSYPYSGSWNYSSSSSGGCPQAKEQPQYSKPSQGSNKPFEQQYAKLIVMFTKDACPYCIYMMPIMKQVEMKFGKDIKFIFADVEQNSQHASQYGFSTVPQIMYFKDGKKLAVHGSGDKTMTVEQVEEKIKTLFELNP